MKFQTHFKLKKKYIIQNNYPKKVKPEKTMLEFYLNEAKNIEYDTQFWFLVQAN